jgi:hypothetical protein
MWIFRVDEPRPGVIRIREWRRRARYTISLLVLLLCGATTRLVALDQSNTSFLNKMFTALWDGVTSSRHSVPSASSINLKKPSCCWP